MTPGEFGRRQFLRWGAAAATAGVAGCGDDADGTESTTAATSTVSSSRTPTSTAATVTTRTTPTAQPTAPTPEKIEVPRAQTKVVHIEERRDNTFENALIDTSAAGAGFRIHASGSDWTIRNVGITGPVSRDVNHVFKVRVDDPEGVGTIENVYVENATHNFMFAHAHHAGHIEIRDSTFINNLRDKEDILYGSPPGNPDAQWSKQTGKGGTIRVANTYAERIGGYGWRLGSDGSEVVNSTVRDVQVGIANLYGRPVEFRDVDVVNADIGLRNGDHVNGKKVPDLTKVPKTVLEDVRIDAEVPVQNNAHGRNQPEVVGSPSGNPDGTPPAAAPRSARAAAGLSESE